MPRLPQRPAVALLTLASDEPAVLDVPAVLGTLREYGDGTYLVGDGE